MNKLDLRQVGTIMGHALYVDVADTIDYKDKTDILTSRDHEEMAVRTILSRAFDMKKECNAVGGVTIGAGHVCRCNGLINHKGRHGCECGGIWNE